MTPTRARAKRRHDPGSQRSSPHSAASMDTAPLACGGRTRPRPRVTATWVECGARGSQHRSRTGTIHATNDSAAMASTHDSAPAEPLHERPRARQGGPLAADRAQHALLVSHRRRVAEQAPRLGESNRMGSVITSSFSWLTGGSRYANATP